MRIAAEAANIRSADIAEALGLTADTVSNYLTGRTRVPRPVLISWARLCRVPLGWLETGGETLDPTWDGGRWGETRWDEAPPTALGSERYPGLAVLAIAA